jgi:hypothetical protein
MVDRAEPAVDAAGLVVPLPGRLVATGDSWEPYRLLDSGGVAVEAARAYFDHLQAAGPPTPTRRSRPTWPSSPAAARCGLPRNTAPPPTPNGPNSSATSSAASSPPASAAAPSAPPASTSTPACAAPCTGPTPTSGPASPKSASPASPASPKPNAKAGSAKPKASKSASPAPRTSSPRSTAAPTAPPTSACPPPPAHPEQQKSVSTTHTQFAQVQRMPNRGRCLAGYFCALRHTHS